ncbi:cobalt ABC transporter permease [Oribacterium sp. C9]|uniref:energy-coupling factor transporter transmembrane component T family protein n=1 Tax=Oribacterium sp. C9 TaxID=1943579 RepID=UPI00098E92B3|nr:energy-coupling factor transporter transmembrane component T [Oribacterium sp. C9]OON88034.1 cobalt ABC transporter permease [Oribacterium sp. C9]
MKSISLYADNGSWLVKLHPFSKMFYLVAAILIPLIAGRIFMFAITVFASICMLGSARMLKKALPLIAFSFTIILTVFIIQGIFYKDNDSLLLSLGPVSFYREGLLYSSHIGLNILNMLLSFSILVLSTSPSELVEELEKKGFSPKLGYIINSVFQIVPEMMGTMHTISDAQRSRGMETEGRLMTRIKAFLPLISPVVMSALTSTRERAIALEVRGFGSKMQKTYLYSHPYSTADQIMKWVSILCLFLVITLRVTGIL